MSETINAKLVNHAKDKEREFESVEEAKDTRQDLIGIGASPESLEVVEMDSEADEGDDSSAENNEGEPRPTEPVNEETESEATQGDIEEEALNEAEELAEEMNRENKTEAVEAQPVEPEEPIEKLSHDPITFLKNVNDDFVNYIHGKPAISKKGFRFIQREFEISTESEVVEVLDDPLGCIVWAKAELPDGYSAEAHGEGYQFEKDVEDNEFVRYADSRAKNRAISDLTSAGALAVSELSGEQNG